MVCGGGASQAPGQGMPKAHEMTRPSTPPKECDRHDFAQPARGNCVWGGGRPREGVRKGGGKDSGVVLHRDESGGRKPERRGGGDGVKKRWFIGIPSLNLGKNSHVSTVPNIRSQGQVDVRCFPALWGEKLLEHGGTFRGAWSGGQYRC